MSAISMTRNGIITTIHEDGSITRLPSNQEFCDGCNTWKEKLNGYSLIWHGEHTLWFCPECK